MTASICDMFIQPIASPLAVFAFPCCEILSRMDDCSVESFAALSPAAYSLSTLLFLMHMPLLMWLHADFH